MKKNTKSSLKSSNAQKDIVPSCPVLQQIEFTGITNQKEQAKIKN